MVFTKLSGNRHCSPKYRHVPLSKSFPPSHDSLSIVGHIRLANEHFHSHRFALLRDPLCGLSTATVIDNNVTTLCGEKAAVAAQLPTQILSTIANIPSYIFHWRAPFPLNSKFYSTYRICKPNAAFFTLQCLCTWLQYVTLKFWSKSRFRSRFFLAFQYQRDYSFLPLANQNRAL